MRRVRQLWCRVPGLGLAIGVFLFCSAEAFLPSERELECEQAVAHLEQCCPGFRSEAVDCLDDACNAPVLLLDESRCIQGKDCDAIRAAGLCEASRYNVAEGADVCQ